MILYIHEKEDRSTVFHCEAILSLSCAWCIPYNADSH